MSKGFLERVNLSAMAINGLGGLCAALMALYTPFEKLNLPQPYTSYGLGAIAAVFVVIVLRAAILAVPLRSILRDTDAFVLRRELPEHLVGRTDDIYRLEHKLNEASLLFVEGESGVGKSALLHAGLAPKLRAGHRYLPVYVESLAGRDWAEGPWRAVIFAFRAALDGKAPPSSRKSVAEAFDELLEAAREAGRMPVLIIDQFDDYQLSHLALFLRAGSWLRAAELTAENPFWAALHAALDGSRLQLIIATRNDMASGLEAARFIEPLPYRVEKVAPQYLRDLIERLSGTASGTAGPIDAPLTTWPGLRARLLDDLASGGAILPQQLKVALLGLQGLPRQQLTVAAYMAVGGVRGLEANWIKTQIDRATHNGKLSPSDIFRLLVALCEPDAVAKTRDLSLSALCEVAGLDDHAAVEIALTALEEGEVVRRLARMDFNESLWRLDHDYISGVVDLANRRANRWELTLAEGRKALAGASGVVQKWEALLPFKTQTQFLLDRAKGRFRYESGRAYALISLARFAPVMLAVLLVTLGYHTIQTNTRNRELAARISASFDTAPELSEKEIKNLIDLSLSNMAVVRDVIGLMLDDPNLAENFAVHLRPMMRAMYLAADGNWDALSETAEPFAEKARESKGFSEIYVVAMLLDKADHASKAATLLVAAMEKNKGNSIALSRLTKGLTDIGDRLPQETAGLAATLLVAAMEKNKDNAGALLQLTEGLTDMGDRLPQETAGLAANRLVAAMEAKKRSVPALSLLAGCLGAIGDRLPQETAGLAATLLVAAMEKNKDDAGALSRLAVGLGAIRDRVPQETAGLAAPLLVAAMEANKGNSFELSWLADGLGAIWDRVPQETAVLAATRLVAAMEANKGNADALSRLAVGLDAIRDRVPQETAVLAATLLVAAMEANKGNADALSSLAVGLDAIRDRLPQETAVLAATLLVAAMEKNKDDADALSSLAVGLGAIRDRLPQETAGLAATLLVAAMERNKDDAGALSRLTKGLTDIGDRLPQETAGLAATLLVAAMEKNKDDAGALSRLAIGLGAIRDRVPQETAGLAAPLLVAAMEANKGNFNELSWLADGLGAIWDRVPQETAVLAATRLVAAMEANKGNASALAGLAVGVGAIGDRMPKVDAQLLSSRLDTLIPWCGIATECHGARIALHSLFSKERAIQLVFLAIRDPLIGDRLIGDGESTIVQRLGRLTGLEFKNRRDWNIAEAWLRKHRTAAGIDDASIRRELRDLMRKRKAISEGRSTS